MNSVGMIFAIMAMCMVGLAVGWPHSDDYSAWRYARTSRRSHHCVGSGNKCFSTTQCCQGFVCAAFDDYFAPRQRNEGMNPEIPGFCVKEKDLQPCYSNEDCDLAARCVPLGRDRRETYCISAPEEPSIVEEAAPIITSAGRGYKNRAGGDIGDSCSDNSDCKPFAKIGGVQLCCQTVSRGRQGKKKICDRVTPVSSCIEG